MKKLFKKGFTIVELVIVIAVIAILAAVLIPTFSGVVEKANASAALQTARSTLTNALNMSSVAQLQGKTANNVYQTVITVDGYAFGYTGNQLEAINYPGLKGTAQLANKAEPGVSGNFNTIAVAAQNLVEDKSDATYTVVDGDNAPTGFDTGYSKYFKKDSNGKFVALTANQWEKGKIYQHDDKAFVFADHIWEDIAKSDDQESTGLTTLTVNKIQLVADVYYLNKSGEDFDAKVLLNSDFSKKAIVFTTFAK